MKTWQFWYAESVQPALSAACLLAVRLWVGWEFAKAGYVKLAGGLTAPQWFRELDFPFLHTLLGPDINWVIAGACEVAFGVALIVGLGTRLAALGLLYVTYVAIYTVHFDLGWAGWNQIETDAGQGFKVPLMLAIMLFVLLGQGAGAWSLDHWRREIQRSE